MKSYVITIMNMERSVKSAQRCIDSMSEFNVEMFPAITPDNDITKICEEEEINLDFFRNDGEKFSRHHRCVAAFLSHYTLWKLCRDSKEEVQIFEHDAVCVNNLPRHINYQGCISLGAPSYGQFNTPRIMGVNPLTSKRYFPGAHAYRIKPSAATVLCNTAQISAGPTDTFLDLSHFPWLEEYYPWPVVARDDFTTIQNVGGCQAKHNFKEGYYDIV